jgi:hypothetical protein
MARIRTIKPEFWRNESLAAISAEACLLAVGLLNHCDDDGYFNFNPKLVQADIFPLRELFNTTTVLLRELSDIGYITVFQGLDGKVYGLIPNFVRHQVINKKNPSKIKGLCELPYNYGSDTGVLPTGKEGNGKGNGKEIKEGKPSLSTAKLMACPQEEILKLWAKHLPHLAQPRSWEGTRRANTKQRWNQASKPSAYSPEGYQTEQAGIKWWDSFFSYIARDTSLSNGFETAGRTWRPDLEWVINATNFQKIIDGKYTK